MMMEMMKRIERRTLRDPLEDLLEGLVTTLEVDVDDTKRRQARLELEPAS